jgi:type IV pilus assembly protein PilB
MSISQLLLERGLLTQEQIEEAMALQRAEGLRLDRALVQLGLITERQLLEIMSEQLHIPLVKLEEITIAQKPSVFSQQKLFIANASSRFPRATAR